LIFNQYALKLGHSQVAGNSTVQSLEYICVLTEENYIKFLKYKQFLRTLFVAVL